MKAPQVIVFPTDVHCDQPQVHLRPGATASEGSGQTGNVALKELKILTLILRKKILKAHQCGRAIKNRVYLLPHLTRLRVSFSWLRAQVSWMGTEAAALQQH